MNHAPKLPLVYAINLLADFFLLFFFLDIVEVTQHRV